MRSSVSAENMQIEKVCRGNLDKKELKKELDRLYTQIQNKTITENELNTCDTLKTEHENILEYSWILGNQIRLRIQEIEFNEKSNNYFYSREKYEYDKKTLGQLNDEEGNIITDKKEIEKQIKRFYENLYTSKYLNEPDFFKIRKLTKLSKNEPRRRWLEQRILRILLAKAQK